MDGILKLLKKYISLKEVAKFYEMEVGFFLWQRAHSVNCPSSV